MNFDEKEILSQLTDPKTKRKAFAKVVERYGQSLYWKIRKILISHEDTNDVLQNTFVKAWQKIGTFRKESKLSTWLYRIAVNESLDFLRKERVRNAVSVDQEESIANQLAADKYFDGDRADALLREAISKLPDVQRAVFNLRYYEEMKYAEISQLLDTSEGALKASYHIAVRKITEYLKNEN